MTCNTHNAALLYRYPLLYCPTVPEATVQLRYCMPSNADTVLCIDPGKQQMKTIGGPLEGDWKWHGGNLGEELRQKQKLECVELAHLFLIAKLLQAHTTNTSRITWRLFSFFFSGLLPLSWTVWMTSLFYREWRWLRDMDAVLKAFRSEDGNIYGIPANATQVGTWCCSNIMSCHHVTFFLCAMGHEKRELGGKWCDWEVLKVDPRTKEVELFGGPFEGRQKWCLGHDGLMLLKIVGPCWAFQEGDYWLVCFQSLSCVNRFAVWKSVG